MKRTRDRLLAGGALIVLVALAAAVVALVLDAQQSGIDAREDLRLEQAQAEAKRMEARIEAAFMSLEGAYGRPGTWTLTPNDPADRQRLTPVDPDSETGAFLVNAAGIIVNGALLTDDSAIGRPYDRDGLDLALGGEAAVLPVGPGLTTTQPTLALAVPARDTAGDVAGAVVLEVAITADSAFNLEIAELRTGETGGFSFVDENGIVVASNDEALLGKVLDDEAVRGFQPGISRAGGRIAAIAPVPSARWQAVFAQDVEEFQGDLTGPLQTALLLFLGAAGIAGVVTAVALLRRLQAAREEQRRLREIGEAREEFTSIVSHELRTPVAGLLGFLQTTIDHWDAMGDAERRRAVNRAFTNARALQTLTSDVLDSASIEAQTLTYAFEPLDLSQCVTEAVEALHDTAPDRTVNVVKPDAPVRVRADALRIRQVLANLLDNASKSSAPDAPIDVEIAVDGTHASVTVRDRGPGIAAEERERIFEKFTRGRAGVGRGTGLGLYISRHIVEAHGGHIDAESVPGEPGAQLRFTVPLT